MITIELKIENFTLTRIDTLPLQDYQNQDVSVHVTSTTPVTAIVFISGDNRLVRTLHNGYCLVPPELLFDEYFFCKCLFNDRESNTITIPVTRYVPPPCSVDWEDVQNKPSTFPPSVHTHPDKQDKLIAGLNITISDENVISATGGGAEAFVENTTLVFTPCSGASVVDEELIL